MPNCPGAKLSGAKLSGAKLSGAKLSYNLSTKMQLCCQRVHLWAVEISDIKEKLGQPEDWDLGGGIIESGLSI